MSENEVNIILDAVETVKQSNDQAHELLKEFILVGNGAIQKNIEASSWVTNCDIKALTARVDRANGNVAKLQAESDARKVVIDDFRKLEKEIKTIRNRWMIILLGFILAVLIVNIVYDLGGFPKMFEWLINKVF